MREYSSLYDTFLEIEENISDIGENISDIGEIFENISDIGENVPVADFGHYADYSAPLIPLSLLKSSLGGGGSAAHMWHCTKLPTHFYSTTVRWYLSTVVVVWLTVLVIVWNCT